MARKRKSKPTVSQRNKKQSTKSRYARAREDAQLIGLIPTVPEGALRDERVSPSLQKDQPLPQLVGQAIRHGWAVPDDRKPRLVDELMTILEDPEAGNMPKVFAYNALLKGDQQQYEKDHPEEAAKAKGGTKVSVGVSTVVVSPMEMYKAALSEVVNEEVSEVAEDTSAGEDALAPGEVLRQAGGDDRERGDERGDLRGGGQPAG